MIATIKLQFKDIFVIIALTACSYFFKLTLGAENLFKLTQGLITTGVNCITKSNILK